jgi:sigma-B regulation protein RsbU (phosphoserine phosphatase)
VTVAAVRIERGGLCSIASAGHSPVIVRSQGVARILLPTSPPLGVPGSSARGEQLRLAPGDVVVVGTDGLIDQRDPSGMSYGPERLLAVVAGAAGSAADMADSIFSALDRFASGTPQEDDQALVVINGEAGAW